MSTPPAPPLLQLPLCGILSYWDPSMWLSFLSRLPENLVFFTASNCSSWQCKTGLWNCESMGNEGWCAFLQGLATSVVTFCCGNSGSWPKYPRAELWDGALLWPVCCLPLTKNCFCHFLVKDIHFMTVHTCLKVENVFFNLECES